MFPQVLRFAAEGRRDPTPAVQGENNAECPDGVDIFGFSGCEMTTNEMPVATIVESCEQHVIRWVLL